MVNLWNSLPAEVVSAPSVNVFKARLDKYWSEYYFILEPEDFLYRLTSDQPMYDVAHQKAELMYIKQMMTKVMILSLVHLVCMTV